MLNSCSNFIYFYNCGLSTATIEYSCPSACLRVCMHVFPSVCVCIHDNLVIVYTSVNNGSIHLKHVVVFENSMDELDIGHCLIKAKVVA